MMLATDRANGALTLRAPAKVNLFLEVTSRRADGYHDIDSVMVAVNLFDVVEIVIAPRLTLSCSDPELPTGSENLAMRAAEALRKATGATQGADIHLTKRIPVQAGLAGGSSDAATTLIGLNQLWKLNLGARELATIAAQVGSDVAFFLHAPAARCTGRGEVVEPIAIGRRLHLVLVCPTEGLSTADVYRALDVPSASRSAGGMMAALHSGDAAAIGQELFNRLQEPAERICPKVRELRAQLAELAPLGCLMSGSGSSLFAICENAAEAHRFARQIRNTFTGESPPRVFVVRSCVRETCVGQ